MATVITIDGPSGAGKGTICKLVAQETGFALLDSGAIYRLTALACLNKEIDVDNEAAVKDIAEGLNIKFEITPEGVVTLLDNADVSKDIRNENVGMTASKVAAYPSVRAALLQRQRDFDQPPGLVADGRDMGTVVFPDAEVKVFLTASAEERAKRRVKQLEEAGQPANYESILKDIEARDHADSTRASAPLKPADDATVLDSTALSIDDVLQHVMALVKESQAS